MNALAKFDLSGVDPAHREWLQQEADTRSMTVDEMLMAERIDKVALNPRIDRFDDAIKIDLAQLIAPIVPSIASAKLRMAIKRHALRSEESLGEYVAGLILDMLACDEDDTEGYVDPMTGLVRPDCKH
jgi:hypothetical protein